MHIYFIFIHILHTYIFSPNSVVKIDMGYTLIYAPHVLIYTRPLSTSLIREVFMRSFIFLTPRFSQKDTKKEHPYLGVLFAYHTTLYSFFRIPHLNHSSTLSRQTTSQEDNKLSYPLGNLCKIHFLGTSVSIQKDLLLHHQIS